jgi:hypothetical protein
VPRAQDLRRAGTFRLLDERLRRIQREQPAFFEDFLDVAATVTAANLPALGDSVDYFLDLGVRTVRLTPRLTWDPDWRLGRAREMGRQLARICRASRRHLRRTGRVPVALFRKQRGDPERRAVPARMCGVGSRGSLVVDVDGSVHGCVLFAHSYQRARPLHGLPGLDRPPPRPRRPAQNPRPALRVRPRGVAACPALSRPAGRCRSADGRRAAA